MIGFGAIAALAILSFAISPPFRFEHTRESRQAIDTLEQAVREHRVCDAEYYTAGRDALSQRQLHPMLLIERRGAWYLAVNRFVPGIRAFFFVAAGAHLMLGEAAELPLADVEEGTLAEVHLDVG